MYSQHIVKALFKSMLCTSFREHDILWFTTKQVVTYACIVSDIVEPITLAVVYNERRLRGRSRRLH